MNARMNRNDDCFSRERSERKEDFFDARIKKIAINGKRSRAILHYGFNDYVDEDPAELKIAWERALVNACTI